MSAVNEFVDLDRRGNVAVITVDNPPVNALSHGVRQGLDQGVTRAVEDAEAEAIVIVCAGRTFIAGADIKEFGKPMKEPRFHAVLSKIEGSPKPVVAAIHGTALGGGLEVALTCHYRVAAPSARFGFPEVKLGLLPGAGGTQRLPRIVGVERALEMIIGGEPIGADEALATGLVDALAGADLTADAVTFAERAVAEGRPLVKVRDKNEKILQARAKPRLFAEFRERNARKLRGFDAPEHCIRALEAAVALPFDEGEKRERELFDELLSGPQSAAQRYLFFAERQTTKIPDLPRDTPVTAIESAAVIGAGTMGGGIAMCFANAGIPVTMVETAAAALDRGLSVIRANYERSAKSGRIAADEVEARLGRIRGTLDLGEVAGADLVIEAVFEEMDLKKRIFSDLDRIAKADAILATNTSYLDVDAIAGATGRPENVIGMHFFSPANVMRLVEVVRGARSSPGAIATGMALAKRLGKVPVLARVGHGFIGNRMLAVRSREAQRLILEGALPQQVDAVLYEFGFAMGPFAVSDLAGLDIGWRRETSTGATLRERLCEAGRLGQKTNAGYYDYEPGSRVPVPNAEVERMIVDLAAEQGITRREISDDEILTRCLYPMINEGARILEEGIAIRASDVDVVWVNGYGWPAYRGGPMFHADAIGLDRVVAKLEEYRARHGDEWRPAARLAELAAAGGRFTG